MIKGDPIRAAPRVQIRFPNSERKDRHAGARGEIPVLHLNTDLLKDQVHAMLGREESGGGMSYDTLILATLESRFRGNDRVTFQYGASKDQITPIFGRTVLTTHGDKIGTKGGMGFAGPMLPIVRGSKKVEAQQASVGRRPDLIQFGHYHTTGNPGTVLANGSVPGYSEYADDLRAVVNRRSNGSICFTRCGGCVSALQSNSKNRHCQRSRA